MPRKPPAYSPEDRTDHDDIQHVHTEEDVPNEAKAAPTRHTLINILSGVAIALVALGLLIGLVFDVVSLGLILTIVALLAGVILIFMALGDARAGAALPIAATVVAAIATLILLLATT